MTQETDATRIKEVVSEIAEAAGSAGCHAAGLIKKVRKPPQGLVKLRNLIEDLPSELDALYCCFDGVHAEAADLTLWQSNLFLDFDFWTSMEVFHSNRVSRRRAYKPRLSSVVISSSASQNGLNLAIGSETCANGSGIFATRYPEHERDFVAFESLFGMLKTVRDAWREDALKIGDRGEVVYDPGQIESLALRHNANAEFWAMLAKGEADWGPSNMEAWLAAERGPDGRV